MSRSVLDAAEALEHLLKREHREDMRAPYDIAEEEMRQSADMQGELFKL